MNYEGYIQAIRNELQDSYQLVSGLGRGGLRDARDIGQIIRGEVDGDFYESWWEWESDCQYEEAKFELEWLAKAISDREDDGSGEESLYEQLQDSPDWDDLHDEIRERDDSTWLEEMLGETPSPVFRIIAGDGNYYDSDEALEEELYNLLRSQRFLDTASNSDSVAEIVVNAGTGYRVPYWVFVADDLMELNKVGVGDGDVFEITNPHLWLTNPMAGDGWMAQINGTLRVRRKDLYTDEEQFGYTVDDVFGLHHASVKSEVAFIPAELS